MNHQESYILFSTLLVMVCLGLRQWRRQQLLAYLQQHYWSLYQRISARLEQLYPSALQQSVVVESQVSAEWSPRKMVMIDSPMLYRRLLASIEHGELAMMADQQLQLYARQLHWLNRLPIIILIGGYLLAHAL